MKLNSVTIIIAAATLALSPRAQADGFAGTSTQFSKVNVALTVQTNKPSVTSGSTENFSTVKTKIDNQALLTMFANWSGANTNEWRTNGAQLIFDWDTYQLAVADKTGSNILFYAGDGVSGGVTAYCTLDWFNNFGSYDYGAFNEKLSTGSPGADTWTLNSEGFFELFYDDGVAADKIDVYGYGPNTEKYTQKWDQAHTYTTWTDSENFKPAGAAQKEIVNGSDHSTVSGTISAKGSGPGFNDYIYAP